MKPQHDDHMAAYELHVWKDWPPEEETCDDPNCWCKPDEPVTHSYVIAKSDSIEHLYWCNGVWVKLVDANRFTRDEMRATPEPLVGFWMDLARAEELEQ